MLVEIFFFRQSDTGRFHEKLLSKKKKGENWRMAPIFGMLGLHGKTKGVLKPFLIILNFAKVRGLFYVFSYIFFFNLIFSL